MRSKLLLPVCFGLLATYAASAHAQAYVPLPAVQDTTIYGELPNMGDGAGATIYGGAVGTGGARRILMQFDVSSIPSGSSISSVTLWLYCTGSAASPVAETFYAHRITNTWGEGTDSSTGGPSVAATSGATWTYRFIESGSAWGTAGSDVNGVASGSWTEDLTTGWKSWTGAGMNNDVSGWVNGTLANDGWMIYDYYPGTAYTARKFDSREGANPPQLQIYYYKPLGAVCGANGECGSGACTNSHCCNTFSCPAQNECQASPPVCGGSGTCNNPAKGDGTACSSDGDPCTVDECITGSCQHPAGNNGAVCTDDGNPCTSDVCNGSAASPGGCTHPAGNNGAACADDGNPCTSDVCSGGGCSHPGGNNGASCNDNNACTQTDTCSGGGCVGSNPVSCPAIDECHTVGTCNPANGVCSTPAKVDGTACTADANPCTLDECLSGVCSHPPGNSGAVCTDDGNACTNDQCNGSSATCQHPPKTAGTACAADANPCTLDQCDGTGVCGHPPGNAGAQCSAASCACPGGPCVATLASTCNGSSATCPTAGTVGCAGALCSGAVCAGGCTQDTDCTSGNFCLGGKCTPTRANGDPLGCSANDYCTSGNCVDGYCCNTACAGGTTDCQACSVAGKLGICSAIPASTPCRAANGVCDAADTCNGTSTVCVDAKAPTGTACPDDGNECTLDQCDGAQNACQHPSKTNGVSCTDDGNVCTTDSCQTGTCSHPPGNAGVTCRGLGGTCDVIEKCTGASPTCPTDAFMASTTPCRSATCAAGVQTNAANCTGSSPACPAATTAPCTPYVCGANACLTTCSVDANCAAGEWCNTVSKTCQPQVGNGTTCTTANSCKSGLCVDGYCCNSSCTGQCQACDVATKPGACTPTVGPPHGSRAACVDDHSACGGACNGVAVATCSYPTATTQCRAPTCFNGTATLGETCNGSGTCPGIQTQDCGQYECGQTACLGNCVNDANCVPGDFCSGNVCKPLIKPGQTCGSNDQCTTGHCVDGVCCDQACGEQCQACDVPDFVGTCSPVAGPPHGTRVACASDSSVCGGECDGTVVSACAYPGNGVVCRAATCLADKAVAVGYCTGLGTCPPEQDQNCGPRFHCNATGTECAGNCLVDTDCSFDKYCSAGVCVPSLSNGDPCSGASQCESSYCVDGVCCDGPCSGQCESCNQFDAGGTCTPVKGAPAGIRPACATDGSPCGGSCDGTNPTGCTYPGPSTRCRNASCAADVTTLAAFCDETGACPAEQLQQCKPNVCSGSTCAGGCSKDTDCTAAQYCSGGVCVSKLVNTNLCATDDQCTSGHCVDGFCCDGACSGQCQACDVLGFVGTCTTVPNGLPHGGRPSCPGEGACAGTCNGLNANACVFPGATKTCGLGLCSGGVETAPSTCNGNGSCLFATSQQCDPFVCAPSTSGLSQCLAVCTQPADCVPGFTCVNGACVFGATPPVDAGSDAAVRDASVPGTGGVGAGGGGVVGTKDAGAGGAPGVDAGNGGQGGRVDGGVPKHGDGGVTLQRSTDTGNCGCRLQSSGDSTNGAWSLVGLGLLGLRRRRRSSRAQA